MRLIITENEKKSILKMYGILNEQKISLPYTHIDSFTSGDADSAHNLKKLENALDSLLPQIYNMGKNPKITDAKLKITQNGNTYNTSYSVTIAESNDGEAWMGFTSRGSIGSDYIERADGQISGKENKDGKSLKQKLVDCCGAVLLENVEGTPIADHSVPFKQYFVQFTKKEFPPHKKKESISNSEVITVTGNTFEEIRTNLKKMGPMSIDKNNVESTFVGKPFKITLPEGNDYYKSFSLIYDPNMQTLLDRFETNIKQENPTREEIKKGRNDSFSWMILGFK